MAKILVIGGLASSLTHFRGALLTALCEQGHEVHACAAGENSRVTADLRVMGVEYHAYLLESTGMNPLTDLKTVTSLADLFARLQPDVIFSYTIKPVVYGAFAAAWKRVPLRFSMVEGLGYTFMVNSLKDRLINHMVCILYRMALKGNRKTFFLNRDDISTFVEKGIIKDESRTVLLNGIGAELDYYKPAPAPIGKCVYLLISRLMPDKGIGIFIDAARILKKRHSDVVFQILGPLTDHPAAYSQSDIQQWQREGIVEYLGVTDDVRPYIANASVFVLPSYYREGVPRTIIEAMAMARPIITTDAPGCRDTVEEGKNGFLIPVHDVSALVKAMEYFLENSGQVSHMGMQSRILAEEKYDIHKINTTIIRNMELMAG